MASLRATVAPGSRRRHNPQCRHAPAARSSLGLVEHGRLRPSLYPDMYAKVIPGMPASALQDALRLVTGQLHRHRPGHSRPPEVPHGSPAEIVEPLRRLLPLLSHWRIRSHDAVESCADAGRLPCTAKVEWVSRCDGTPSGRSVRGCASRSPFARTAHEGAWPVPRSQQRGTRGSAGRSCYRQLAIVTRHTPSPRRARQPTRETRRKAEGAAWHPGYSTTR
jgi:hypothetical protein